MNTSINVNTFLYALKKTAVTDPPQYNSHDLTSSHHSQHIMTIVQIFYSSLYHGILYSSHVSKVSEVALQLIPDMDITLTDSSLTIIVKT